MRLADIFHPHDPTLVIVSVSVAILAAYVSLELAGRIRASTGWIRWLWLATGAISLGGGIWGRDPFDLLDEIEQSLALDVTPASWPIGMGRDFLGAYDLLADALLLFEHGVHDPKLPRLLPKAALAKLRKVAAAEPDHVRGAAHVDVSPFRDDARREQ